MNLLTAEYIDGWNYSTFEALPEYVFQKIIPTHSPAINPV